MTTSRSQLTPDQEREMEAAEKRAISDRMAMAILDEAASTGGISFENPGRRLRNWGYPIQIASVGNLFTAQLLDATPERAIGTPDRFRATARGHQVLKEHPVPARS